MRVTRLGRAAAIVALGLVAVACGGSTSGSGSGGSKGTISIGVDLPESGASSSSGLPTLNGVKYAVQKAGGSIDGWTLTVENRDDAVGGSYNTDKGVQNVTDLIGTNTVVAMVGPFNSAVAQAEIPITNVAGLTMISPSNTNPCLTKDLSTCAFHPQDLRKKANNYFRVVATDDLQGPAMADYAYNTLGIKTIGIMDEKSVYGVGIADAFQAQFVKDGGKYQRQSFDPKTTTDWRAILQGFKDFGATGIYMGGTDDQKACQPRGQMNALGIGSWPYLGGDGLTTSQCIDDAADSALGLSATTAGADASQIPSAAGVITDFKKSFTGANDYGAYTMTAYDAANIEIAAIKKAIDGGANPKSINAFREAVRNNVSHTTNFPGVLGSTTFDANGDTSQKIISIFAVKQETQSRVAVGDLTCGKAGGPNALYCFEWTKQVNFGA
ncbi:MAG TPA: branched-chain amino acid ABC transporter substrate-binding protein [Candidatus Dormibacteraeota bacterium]|nr:branched-chain amino acid ABC transporter substrate-binding protein [Candidatus Dormibacteraeota bacterium]